HDFTTAKKINDTLIKAYDLMFVENNPAGVKAFMHIQGLIDNYLRMPNVPVGKELFEKITNYVNGQ
ncbi:dihydrodipicolinate synthase family protein, partial [Staphylococcus aureus]